MLCSVLFRAKLEGRSRIFWCILQNNLSAKTLIKTNARARSLLCCPPQPQDLLKKEQKQEEKETKGGPGKLKRQGSTFGKSLLESYRESDSKSQSPESQIPEVWKAGRLKKKQRSNGPFGIWQERAFEVHRDGHILWGKPTTTSKSWKMEEIGSFRCQPNEDFQFEVHFRRKKECLVLRALNRASFNRWMERIPAIIKLAEKERAEKEEEHQDINEFLDDEDNPHEADLDAFLS